jgi:mediator of RNA polymerase II transcription subunit 16
MVNPTITIRHLAVTNWMDGATGDGGGPFHLQPSMVALSHLSILQPSPDGPNGQPTLPTILTVRSLLPSSPSHYNQETHSIIDRWELHESAQSVHSAFEQLSHRRNSTALAPGVC